MTAPRHTHFIRAWRFGGSLLGLIIGIGLFASFAPELLRLFE